MFGVDTPEISNQYNGFQETTNIEYNYAVLAREYARNLILNKNVNINQITVDQYNRHVARIGIDNKDLSIELLRHGLARIAYVSVKENDIYFTSDFEYYRLLLIAQKEAFDSKLGFWNQYDQFKIIFPKA